MKRLLLATACAAILSVAATGAATATPLSGTFGVTLWHGFNPNIFNPQSTDASEQALPSAIGSLITTYTKTFTYTGPLNLSLQSDPASIRAFFASGGGTTSTVLPNTVMSTSGFGDATLIKFTFTTAAISGTISDDDGVSLFASGTTATDLFPVGWADPTNAVTHAVTLAAGTYDLYYSEVNGAPASLDFEVTRVPEPATLSLLGLAFAGAGLANRRNRRAT